jgi:hypothetical protein
MQPINETTFIQFSDKTAVDEVFDSNIANPRILQLCQALNIAQPLDGRIRLQGHVCYQVLVSFLRWTAIRDSESPHNDFENRGLIFGLRT